MKKEKTKNSKVTNLLKSIERIFMPIMTKIGENRYINAIRNGMISIIPILLIGSTFMIIFFFPIGASETLGQNVLMQANGGKWAYLLMLPYRLTYPMLGLFAVIGISRSLAKTYKLDEHQAILMTLIAYLISITGPTYKSIGNPSFTTGSFGSATVFGGILVSIFSVEIFRICTKYNIMIRLPKSVPAVVAKPFNALIPMLLVMIPCLFVFNYLEFNIHSYANYILAPLQGLFAGNNYLGFVLVVLLIMILWIAGIHGVSVVGALARPFWLVAIAENTQLLESLKVTQLFAKDGGTIITEPFFQWFVWIGGAGATFGLVLVMLLFAKSKYIRAITYPSIIPGLCNINEPIIFGYPLVLNPYLALPAILSPIVLGTITFICMSLNIIPVATQTAGWTLPTPVGALLSTGLSWQACLFTFVLMFISALVWFPFAKAYDRKMVREEIEQETQERIEQAKKDKVEYNEELIREQVRKEINSRSIFKRKNKVKSA